MPNLKVLQDQPEKLKSQLYGFDGSNVLPLLTDNTGRTNIRPLTISDTITTVATDLDIRDLANGTDSIAVYGNDGTQNRLIKTNADGQLDVRPLTSTDTVTTIVSISHLEIEPVVFETGNAYVGSSGQDVSIWRTYSFFAENTSATANSATLIVQISPDNIKWVDDSSETVLAQGEFTVLSASRYLRYARVAYKSTTTDQAADIAITFQAQG